MGGWPRVVGAAVSGWRHTECGAQVLSERQGRAEPDLPGHRVDRQVGAFVGVDLGDATFGPVRRSDDLGPHMVGKDDTVVVLAEVVAVLQQADSVDVDRTGTYTMDDRGKPFHITGTRNVTRTCPHEETATVADEPKQCQPGRPRWACSWPFAFQHRQTRDACSYPMPISTHPTVPPSPLSSLTAPRSTRPQRLHAAADRAQLWPALKGALASAAANAPFGIRPGPTGCTPGRCW